MLLTSSRIRQSARAAISAQEFPLGQRRVAERHVARDVLQQDAPAEDVLHGAHPLHDVRERLLGVGQRQQVVGVAPGHAGPAQVVGDPRRLDACGERLHLAQVVAVERIGAADRHRDAVHHQRVALAHAHQVAERLAARHQVVLGEHLEPVDARGLRENGLVVIDPQAESETERWIAEHGGTGRARLRPARHAYLVALALAASHSALVISRKPLPLQEFWPLQALLALLQAE